MKFGIRVFKKKSVEKIHGSFQSDKNNAELCTFMISR